MLKPSKLEPLDLSIAAALQLNGRATWKSIASAIGTTESTVARRAQRLMDSGVVRVVGVLDLLKCGLGTAVIASIQCLPGETAVVGRMMAERADARFVTLVSGGTDVVVEFVIPNRSGLLDLIGHEFAQTKLVSKVRTYPVLRGFQGVSDWDPGLLGPAATEQLRPRGMPAFESGVNELPLPQVDDLDLAIMTQLAHDGRKGYGEIAESLETSQATVSRRIDELLDSGCIRFRTIVEPAALGFPEEFMIWCKCAPINLSQAGETLARHPSVKYLVATSGDHQLIGRVALRNHESIYEFLTGELSQIPGITDAEITLEIDTLKQSWMPIRRPASNRKTIRTSNPLKELGARK